MEDYEVFRAAHDIAKSIVNYVENATDVLVKPIYHEQEPTPFLDRKIQGMFLEMDCDTPRFLWTEWGKWPIADFAEGRLKEGQLDGLLDTLGATLHRAAYFVKESYSDEFIGPIGPIYFVGGNQDRSLSNPLVEYLSEPDFSEFAKHMKEWRELKAMYNQGQAEQPMVVVA